MTATWPLTCWVAWTLAILGTVHAQVVPDAQQPPIQLEIDAPLEWHSYARHLTIRSHFHPPDVPGGFPADPATWPATRYFKALLQEIPSDPGTLPVADFCTSTIVGAKVLLTAAHCVADDSRGTVATSPDGRQVGARCEHHPLWPDESWADYALCVLDDAVQSQPFETVYTSLVPIREETLVVLLGFGCLDGNTSAEGELWFGWASVISAPNYLDFRGRIDDASTRIRTQGGAGVCGGDSGGGAYLVTGPGLRHRVLIGIAARGWPDAWILSTANPHFLRWALEWSRTNSVTICGLHSPAAGCRH